MGIAYELNLNEDTVKFAYGDNPTNAQWCTDETGAVAAITFDSEALLPGGRPAFTDPQERVLSPFIQMATIMGDIIEFKTAFNSQVTVLRNREALCRLLVHIERENWDVLLSELKSLGADPASSDPADLRHMVQCVLGDTQNHLIRKHQVAGDAARLFSGALHRDRNTTEAFLREYRTSGRLRELWRQTAKARTDFLNCANALIPLLQVQYWTSPPPSLADCYLPNKQFELLKALYIDCFETLARVSVVLLGLHHIGANGTTDVPTNNGRMDIWSFERLPNANKPAHLLRAPACASLAPHLDTTLRNGIGHNSAHYDPATDEVVLMKQQGAAIDESRLSYTSFASHVFDVTSLLMELHLVAFWILDANNGSLA